METVNKRYYWLKLQEDFFGQKPIKRLRKIAGGDTYTIIYLKMLLKSLSNNGVLFFDGIEENFISELALDIDEEEDDVNMTVQYLLSKNILVELSEEEFLLTTCADMVGSETASTRRSRKSRNNKKLLLCNNDATKGNGEIEKEIEIDREIEIEKEKWVTCQQIADLYNDTCVSFPRLKNLSDSRKKAIKARLRVYTVEDFKKLFEKAEASAFLKGANERNWSATFDWLIKDNNMAKVLDGNYDDTPKGKRKEIVPSWMSENRQNYDFEKIEKEMVVNNPDLSKRAEDLKKRINGGE